MRITFWGTRGSITTPGPDKVRHGSNTACVSVRSGSDSLILDAGIGIILLGERILAARRPREPLKLHLLLSHLHWDHVIGIPFFTPVFFKSTELEIWGRNDQEVESAIERLFTSTYSPIKGTVNLGATLRYRSVGETALQIGPFLVTTCPLRHPSGSTGYRVEAGGRALVYASDHEAGDAELDAGLVSLARGADVLIHDAQWRVNEQDHYASHGHSSWAQALENARMASVKTLVLFHHHHRHDDDTLDEMGVRAQKAAPPGMEIIVARDGLLLEV